MLRAGASSRSMTQVPNSSPRVLPIGPITAILPVFCSGRICRSFFSSTIDSPASSRAVCKYSGDRAFFWRSGSVYWYGLSNSPSLYLASRMRRHAWSISCRVTFPSSSDFFSVQIKAFAPMSMSSPAFSASAATCCRSPMPWAVISPTDPASETTNPSNFHWSRNTSVSSQRLPVAGIPSTTLNDDMKLPAPASAAALYGGR